MTILCDPVGALVFAAALSTLSQATTPPEPLLAQWPGSVLLGAVHVAQPKYLNWDDPGNLLGQSVRFPTPQREQLARLATPATLAAVLRWSGRSEYARGGDPDHRLCVSHTVPIRELPGHSILIPKHDHFYLVTPAQAIQCTRMAGTPWGVCLKDISFKTRQMEASR